MFEIWPTSRPICFGGFPPFRRRSYPRIYLVDRHHHLRRYRCHRYPVHHLRDIYTNGERSVRIKVKYISSFVQSGIRAAFPKDRLEFNFFRNLVPTYSLLWKVLVSVLRVKYSNQALFIQPACFWCVNDIFFIFACVFAV